MRLQTYLTRNGIAIEEFAARVGISSISTVYRYLRCERIPCLRIMEQIHNFTGGAVTAEDFFAARRVRRERAADLSLTA